MWYAAHIITAFRYREPHRKRRQRRFYVWENIVLIRARSPEEAWKKAEEYAREEASHDDKTLRMNGVPVTMDFAGIHKVVEVVDPKKRPAHGTEITYNEFNIASPADLKRLVAGDPVYVEYQE